MSEEEIFRNHEIDERAYNYANALESARRTRIKLQQASIDRAHKQVSFTNGTPVRAFTPDQISQMQANVDMIEQNPFSLIQPEGHFTDDTRPNNFSTSFYEPDQVRKAWMALIQRTPAHVRTNKNMAEASSRVQIRELRRR